MIALLTVFPAAISSLILALIITLASTAIPIPRIIPAIPGNDNVKSKAFNVSISNSTKTTNAKLAATPAIL